MLLHFYSLTSALFCAALLCSVLLLRAVLCVDLLPVQSAPARHACTMLVLLLRALLPPGTGEPRGYPDVVRGRRPLRPPDGRQHRDGECLRRGKYV